MRKLYVKKGESFLRKVDEKFFCREIKNAHIICSSDYGYLISLFKDNPYQNKKFCPPENCNFFFWECEWGSVLKLEQDNRIKITAFHLTGKVEGSVVEEEDDSVEDVVKH